MDVLALWTILIGALVAGACGFIGCFLVLRRLSMLGDAISHAVLPGIVIAALLTHSLTSWPIFLGALLLGLLTAFLVQSLAHGGVQGDAAMGVTFTALFALGVLMVSLSAGGRQAHLDTDCVLYGEISLAALDRLVLGGTDLGPRAVWVNGGLFLLNLLVVSLFYKQFKICAFDPQMAAAVGINVAAMHYLLMGLVSITVVGAFESVGAVLVVAMLVAPGVTAYLLTDRLERMLALAVLVGILSSALGYGLARALNASVAGAMATVAGGLFALAFLFSPRHGLVSRWRARRQLRRQVAEEDALLWVARQREREPAFRFTAEELSRALAWPAADARATLRRLTRAGLMEQHREAFALTRAGSARAQELLRRHRLYESYLHELGYPTDHQHDPADRVEHHVSNDLAAALNVAVRFPERDPQGKPIPPAGTG